MHDFIPVCYSFISTHSVIKGGGGILGNLAFNTPLAGVILFKKGRMEERKKG